MASVRAAEAARSEIRPEDSASAVGSHVGSQASWSLLPEEQTNVAPPSTQAAQGPEGQAQGGPQLNQHSADPAQVESDDQLPPTDPSVYQSAPCQGPVHGQNQAAAAPATQAAKNLLGSAQKQAERLARQKAQAKRKGQRQIRWGQMPGQNAQNFQLPHFIQQIGAGKDEQSVLVMDSRDRRIQSPFQGWLVDEILLNAQSGVNILSDRQLVRSPNTGYHMNLFYVRTLNGFKVILVGSMTSYGTVPCAGWDAPTSAVLAHQAFQPFRWPKMSNESATWVDVKVKVEGQLLLHLELRGYKADHDMTVQMNYLDDVAIANLQDTLFVPSCVVTVFAGWRVVATSFEVGGRLYACSDHGRVVVLDFPLCHFEIRLTATSSADSIGMDADRLEFRFRSSGDQLDVACSQVTVPSTWLVVSRVSGPTLIKNARWCRDHYARVEGPDQTLQLSQLAGVHAHWTASIEAGSMDETGPRVGAVAVESHPSNIHLTCESPLFRAAMAIVPTKALALQSHDVSQEQEMVVLPPVTGGPSVMPVSAVTDQMRALTGPAAPSLVVATKSDAVVSMTEPGQAPVGEGSASGSVRVHRRPLEVREAENLAEAAMTPQAFLDQAQRFGSSSMRTPMGQPRSFGPPPVVEEVEEC